FAILAVASGIIGNRADRVAVWSYQRLMQWFRTAISGYVSKKNVTTNIEEIAADLELMMRENGIQLEPNDLPDEGIALFPTPPDDDAPEVPPPLGEQHPDKARVLAERIDHSLRRATEPMGRSCERIILQAEEELPMLEFGPPERAVIEAPLTLPAPKTDWRAARVKFERINRKTGRALFYFENEVNTGRGAHYSRITDPTFRRPHNRYTQAFDNDAPLDVWVRQTKPEKGHLNLQWEIKGTDPDQGLLFNLPPDD
ncbi:MAG: hypothetical protein JWP03_4869, partial [Phycisphaerales bacterium]|nr:hypothetical protein [Phycisphaerales bacterium]